MIDPKDRGLAFGDGVFETMVVLRHRVRLLALHVERLCHGLQRLRIPTASPQDWYARIRQRAMEPWDGQDSYVLKLMVTRGVGERGYALPSAPRPTYAWVASPMPHVAAHAEQGITVRYGSLRLAPQPLLAGIKHLNRLEQVLARSEWDDAGIQESVLCDHAGYVIEGVMSNLMLRLGTTWRTHLLEHCGVAGVMRRWVMETLAAKGVSVQECRLRQNDVAQADEAFMTNAVIGVWPVMHTPGKTLTIGATTRALQKALVSAGELG